MVTLISYSNSSGEQGRCDAKCYDATQPECECICGGANHGAGLQWSICNTRELAQSWIARSRAAGQAVPGLYLAIEAVHEPLFALDQVLPGGAGQLSSRIGATAGRELAGLRRRAGRRRPRQAGAGRGASAGSSPSRRVSPVLP